MMSAVVMKTVSETFMHYESSQSGGMLQIYVMSDLEFDFL